MTLASPLGESKKIYNICIISAAGDGNTGHEAILAGIVYPVKNEIPNVRIRAFYMDPKHTRRKHNDGVCEIHYHCSFARGQV